MSNIIVPENQIKQKLPIIQSKSTLKKGAISGMMQKYY